MGPIGDFVGSIVDVITDIADGIWNAIRKIGQWIEDQIGWINAALIVIVVIIIIVAWPYAMAAYEGSMLSATMAATETMTTFDVVVAQTVAASIGLQAGFAAFLEAIYFDVILSVHYVAYLVSPQYREMFQKVINEIMQISEVLGLGPSFIILALDNARTLVLTVSGMFGMKYDLAQIQWLSVLNEYLKSFAAKANSYKNNPGLLLLDMGEMINRPVMDQMGEYWQTIIKTIDRIITNAASLAKVLTDISRDLDAFIQDLPDSIKKQITPITDPIIRNFNDFVRLDFKPTINIINGVIDVLEVKQTDIKLRVDDTIDRLLYPAKYLHEIDDLDPDLQTEQAWSLAEVTTRPQRELFEYVAQEGHTVSDTLQSILEALATRLPRPPYDKKPLPRPVRVPQITMKQYTTWYVGDY